MEENRRRSQRIIDAEILAEENRLIILGGRLLKRSPSGTLVHIKNISTIRYHRKNRRFYIKTQEGFLIRDIGVCDGSQEEAEADKPEPESRAIKLYLYKDKLYRQTKDGVLTEDENILQGIVD